MNLVITLVSTNSNILFVIRKFDILNQCAITIIMVIIMIIFTS